MNSLFTSITSISITAGWTVIAVMILRKLLGRAPKNMICSLWLIVGLRLCVPFSVESVFSLIPRESFIIPGGTEAVLTTGASGFQGKVLPIVWILGTTVLTSYGVLSYISLKLRLKTATRYEANIFRSENVRSSFVLGIFRPKIYIPYGLKRADRDHIIAHERSHLKRGDHLIKAFSFLLLAVHWFNPLIWVAYTLLCRDIEQACDERVIRELGNEGRRAYSETLLRSSVRRQSLCLRPLTFGEVGVKGRIRSIMTYKRATRGMAVTAVFAITLAAATLLTDPYSANDTVAAETTASAASDEKGDSASNISISTSHYYSGSFTRPGIYW